MGTRETQARKSVEHHGVVISVEKGAGEDDLGSVWGIAIISTVDGKMYVDDQDEHIPTKVMKRSADSFIDNSRDGKIMHEGDVVGRVRHSVPLTNELAKSLSKRGVLTEDALLMECWLIEWVPETVEARKRFDSGELKAFSVHGDGLVVDREIDVEDIATTDLEGAA